VCLFSNFYVVDIFAMHKLVVGFAKRREVTRIMAWYCGKSSRVVDLFGRFLAGFY